MSTFIDVARSYKNLKHQNEALLWLTDHIDADLWNQFLNTWRKPQAKPAATNPLPVPYLHQQDMASDGWRKCFTTTAAMIAEYLGAEPRGVAGERAYDAVRANYGDTTVATAQLAALRHLGLDAHYGTDGTKQRIIDLLDQGHPVGLGMLHHGSTAHPTGGHWILAIGHTPTHCIVHDPYGEQDLARGTWTQQGTGGEAVHYSWANLLPRWQPGGSGGWYLWAAEKPHPPAPADYPNTWEGVEAAAKACGARWPQLVAAQWALESAHGTALSGKHNYFGIKGSGSSHVTQEEVNGQMVTITAGFIDFPCLKDCVEYLVTRWYLDYKGYQGVNHAASADAAAYSLKAQGYATDSQYPQKLISLMRQHA